MNLLTGSWLYHIMQWASDGAHWLWAWSWQALGLLACIWLAQRIRRTNAPALRHQVWLCGLIAVAVLPFCALFLQWFPLLPLPPANPTFSVFTPAPSPLPIELFTADTPQPVVDTTLIYAIAPALFAVWLIGALFKLTQSAKSNLKLHRILAAAQRTSAAELDCAEVSASVLKEPAVRLSPEIHTPILCGVFRPIILLPADIAEWTTPAERASMIRHELAHIERRDAISNLLQTSLQIVFFFHPLVRYACRQLKLERELACDDRVVELGTAAEVYAAGILKVVERSFAPRSVHHLALFSTKQVLERRVEMILNTDRVRVINTNWRYLILPIALLALVSMLVLPLSPAKASLTTVIEDSQGINQSPSPSFTQDPWILVVKIPEGGGGYNLNTEDHPSLDDLSRRLNQILSGRPADKKLVSVFAHNSIDDKEVVNVFNAIKAAGGIPVLPQSPWDLVVKVQQGGRYTINDREDYSSLEDLSKRLKEVLSGRPSDRKMVIISAPGTITQKETFKISNMIRLAGGLPILLRSPWDLVVAIAEGGQRYNLNNEDHQTLGDLGRRLKEILSNRPANKKTVSVVAPNSLAREELLKVYHVIKAAGGTPDEPPPPPPPPPPPRFN